VNYPRFFGVNSIPEYLVKLRVLVKVNWASIDDLWKELEMFNNANKGVIEVLGEDVEQIHYP